MSEPQPDLEPPQHGLYMLFLLVLVFFLMGLVGFMICHVLKKKGYRCRTSRGSEPDDTQLQPPEDDDMNDDTVERIVRCIIQNEANAEALKEMLGDSEGEGTMQLSSVDATSSLQDGAPSHHHTVHLGSAAPCIHCSRNKRPPLVRQGRSKEGKSRPRPGETTVFSVGRFRVTHIEKRYGLHEHRDGSPTDRSWGSGGGQDPGGGQGSGGGQPRTEMPAIESLPPERPQPQALASPPVQNGGLRDSSLVPRALERSPGASAESMLGAGGRGPSPGLASQEENGQPSTPDTSDHQPHDIPSDAGIPISQLFLPTPRHLHSPPHPLPMVLDLVVSGSSARPALNFFLQATLPGHTSCAPLQLQDTHLISPCWLKLLRWGGGKYSRLLKKKLQILLPAYLGGRLPPTVGMLQSHLCSFQLSAAQ